MRRHDESGSSPIETVILFPVVIVAILSIIQFALWYHAQEIVRASADEGAESARLESGTADAGRGEASAFLVRYGSNLVQSPNVDVQRTNTEVRVEVSGELLPIIRLYRLPLHASVQRPVEKFVPSAAS